MPIQAIPPEQLRRTCRVNHFAFESTAELETISSIIGQPRGTQAIEFGIGIQSHGYNMYVLGDMGTGRTTAIKRFLEEKTRTRPVPPDWVYVNNFGVPHQPRAISLPPGQGAAFQSAIATLLACLEEDLPKAFDTDAYREAGDTLMARFNTRQDAIFNALQMRAAQANFALVSSPSGPMIAPVAEGKVMSPEAFAELPLEQREAMLAQQEGLNDELDDALRELRLLESEMREQLTALNRQVADGAIDHHFAHWRKVYETQAEVLTYLAELRQDVLDHLDDFTPQEPAEGREPVEIDLSRYEVNLLVDHSRTEGAPVVVEPNPTYHNLIGRVEYDIRFGVMTTHFTNLKAGSLHRANGGYLVINARDLLRQPAAWEALKRAIKGAEIRLQSPDMLDGAQMLAKSLDPEPIPLAVKIILLGSPDLYYALYDEDEEFGELFKVKADFDSEMPRDDQHEYEYALFIANRCREEGLLHFDRAAVEKVVEYGARLAEHQDRLSTRFGEIADLVREASYWATKKEQTLVTAEDVRHALEERIYRSNRLESRVQENIRDGLVLLATEGAVVGQVNGLSVLDMGDYAFGQPGRITARTYMGESGVINIEREVELAGPIHNKGLLTLVGYLGGKYAQNYPLSLSASLTFEQNYGGIDGDSASAAELLALISRLSGLPLKQSIAVTGSVNQRGEIQPVGGLSEKVEGFFDVCQSRGLTGEQGVLVPAANVRHLMLREGVVAAVAAGRFHLWTMTTIDDGIELLTGIPAGVQDSDGAFPEGTVHHAAQATLYRLAKELKKFS